MRRGEPLNRARSLLRTAIAVALGLGPGLLLPFVLALQLAPAESDRAVLAFSVATSLIGIAVPAVEARSIADSGRAFGATGLVRPPARRALVLSSLKWTVPGTLGGAVLLGWLYGLGESRPSVLWAMIAVVSLAPLIGSVAAVNSGILISRGRTTLAIATQGLRAALPLCVLFALPALPALALASLFVGGELVRFVVLTLAVSHLSSAARVDESVVARADVLRRRSGGLGWQMGANAIGELNPIAARTYLAPYPSGSVTALELSEKVLGMSTQVAYNFVVLRRVWRWSTADVTIRYRLFRRDILAVAAVASATSLCGIGLIQGARGMGLVPEPWGLGLDWACLALIAGPAVAVASGAVRHIAVLDAQRALAGLVSAGVCVNAVLLGIGIAAMGSIGAVVALVITRYLVMGGMLALIHHRESRAGG